MTQKIEEKISPKVKVKKEKYFQGIGRRKRATASCRLFPGGGEALVNGKPISEYFKEEFFSKCCLSPLILTKTDSQFRLQTKVKGGGPHAQAEAIRMGTARALLKYDPSLRPTLKKAGYLRRDPREKERKKYGLRGARRGRQFRKR